MDDCQPSSKLSKIVGIGVLSLGILLFSIITIIFFANVYPGSRLFIDYDEPFLNSRYISEDIATDTFNPNGTDMYQENIINEKQGVLVVDEKRKVITFEKDLSQQEIKSIESTYGVKFLEGSISGKIYVLSTTEESSLTELSQKYSTVIETDIPVKIASDMIDWGITRIGADKVWNQSTGSGVKIAIVDTGVQRDHPDLKNNIIQGYDFVNDDNDPTDDNGHGTHVAGIASAVLNQTGTVGASYNAQIMPIKVLNNQGYGYLSGVAKGIYFAADNGARIINMSLGSSTDSITLRNAVTYAANKGILLVAAAGNNSGGPCLYPAAYSSVICVVATDSKNQLASFSNMGGELAAPGVSNYSTFVGSSYRYLSGTSMASPHVAGAGAILISKCPTCTTSEIRNILRNTAIDLGDTGKDILFGYGLVDLVSAMNYLSPNEETPIVEEPTQPTNPTLLKPQQPKSPESPKSIKQSIKIEEPTPNRGTKYIPNSVGDISVKFSLTPYVENSDLQKIVLLINNQEVYSTTRQSDTYTIPKDMLDHSQNWLSVTAIFNDGSRSSEKMILDLTYFKTFEKVNLRDRSVLGVSFSILDWFRNF